MSYQVRQTDRHSAQFELSPSLGDDQERFWGPKMNVTVAISHFLITLNCSCNFLIYCAKVKPRLRRTLLYKLLFLRTRSLENIFSSISHWEISSKPEHVDGRQDPDIEYFLGIKFLFLLFLLEKSMRPVRIKRWNLLSSSV